MVLDRMTRYLLALAAGAALLGPAATVAQTGNPGISSPNQNLVPQNKPYLYTSNLGFFQVMMPGGCAQVHQRERGGPDDPFGPPAAGVQAVTIKMVTCDYNQEKGRGCAVTAIFDLKGKDGGDPGSDEVLSWVTNNLVQFRAVVRRQTPVAKDFPGGLRVEGVDVQASQEKGKGEFWIRGLLCGTDIYILAAWNIDGGLWNDPDYQQFFNSFTPLAR